EAVLIVYVISMFLGVMAYIINGANLINSLIMLVLIITGIIVGFWKIGIFTVELPSEGSSLEEGESLGN
ncbi:MAG: undecaprenyl/decaprenyl-phosphate alpha-N-acetylglucosaminyl 1-phosphate transferase, partial [Halanaerobiales bacterium]